MANVNQNIVKQQQSRARNRVINGAWADQSNVDMIPEGGEFVALRNSTIRINQAMALGRSAQLVICAELAHIKGELESLRDMNAKNGKKGFMQSYDIRDFAEEMFGLKKSQAYSLARVGERFLSDDGSLKREYIEVLGGVGASVLGLLVNSDDATIIQMSDDLDGKMTAANIRAWNKALKEGKPDNSERSENTTLEANENASEKAEKAEKAESAVKVENASEKSERASESASEIDDTMTFNETEEVTQLHIVLEVRDGITELCIGDGDAARRRVYSTTADLDTIIHDLVEVMRQA